MFFHSTLDALDDFQLAQKVARTQEIYVDVANLILFLKIGSG